MKYARCNSGIEKLTEQYRAIFRIPENINHYSEKDYQAAERKFLKFALLTGSVPVRSRYAKTGQYTV